MNSTTFMIIVGYMTLIIIAKKLNYISVIGTYELFSMFSGAVLFCIFNGLKIFYLKKSFKVEDVILTAFVIFSAGILKRVIMRYIYPKADRNKDGMVTAREFYIWREKINKLEKDFIESNSV